jgi:hypothetical protein
VTSTCTIVRFCATVFMNPLHSSPSFFPCSTHFYSQLPFCLFLFSLSVQQRQGDSSSCLPAWMRVLLYPLSQPLHLHSLNNIAACIECPH